ncbi:helix-hairpin-helix domain-containing protein [Flavobacterium sp.]|uniref:helix-hairpin-helix domain-containing protein n=1 Tax=Flavobacterium sp. TaxID=239 RepID=UPI002FDD8794
MQGILKSFISFSKSQRIGLVLLFAIAISIPWLESLVYFSEAVVNEKERALWLSKQVVIDSMKLEQKQYKPKLYPFNPNFITDFKGYQLGMSVAEIDRLLAYRKQNKFVNSATEFQQVTQVSDSLLKTIAPYFKFPDWVTKSQKRGGHFTTYEPAKATNVKKRDINEASKEDLMQVYGIGDKISDRILQQKEKLGAFVSMEQLQDVWGLSPEVIQQLHTRFEVQSVAKIKKINVNSATVKELTQFPFFQYETAKAVVVHRSMKGDIKIEDLANIKGFPVDKIKIIALYLEF